MEFIRKSFWTILASLAFAIQSFATSKLVAIYFGPEGVTLLAHFQNMIAMYTTLITDGVNRGVQRLLSQSDLPADRWNRVLSSSVLIYLGTCIIITLFLILAVLLNISGFPNGLFTTSRCLLFLLSMILHLASIFFVNLWLAEGNAKWYSVMSILNNCFGMVLITLGTLYPVFDALVWFSFAPAAGIIVIAFLHWYKHRTQWNGFTFTIATSELRELLQFMLLSVAGVVFGRFVDFFVRSYAMAHFSPLETGHWQAVVKMSDGYSTVFIMAFGSLFFVKISSHLANAEALRSALIKSMAYVTVLTVSGLTTVWLLREWLLKVFYSEQFLIAQQYVQFQLLGDAFKFPSWLLSFVLMSQLRTNAYLWAHAASAALFCLSAYLLVPYFQSNAMPMAHFIRYVGYFALMVYLLRKNIFLRATN